MRPSGRAADQLRTVLLEPGFAKHAEGSCLVRMGDTHVLCTATIEDKAPPKARPAARVNLHGYLTSIYRRVVRYKHYPPAARRLRLQGRVLVRMRIDRSGKLLAAEVKRSSGHAVLDRAALGIVRNAAPYAGMPTAYGKPSVKIVVPVDFRLES